MLAQYSDAALLSIGHALLHPELSLVHSWSFPSQHAVGWGRLRNGSGSLGAQRISRHTSGSIACRLCGGCIGDLAHSVLHCPSTVQAQGIWCARVAGAIGVIHDQMAEILPIDLTVCSAGA